MSDSIEIRVARGVALLDRTLADWDERIDLDRLDLESTCGCILGQEFADYADDFDNEDWTPYDAAISELPIDGYGDAWRYGFDRHRNEGGNEYADLTAEWKRVILARRGGAS